MKKIFALAVGSLLLTGAGCASSKPAPVVSQASIDQMVAEKLTACGSIPPNVLQNVSETTRLSIKLPKDVYPYDAKNVSTKTVSGDATMGVVSNGGIPGQGIDSTAQCWSTYYELDGNGEVDLTVKSTSAGIPDYVARFQVGKTK